MSEIYGEAFQNPDDGIVINKMPDGVRILFPKRSGIATPELIKKFLSAVQIILETEKHMYCQWDWNTKRKGIGCKLKTEKINRENPHNCTEETISSATIVTERFRELRSQGLNSATAVDALFKKHSRIFYSADSKVEKNAINLSFYGPYKTETKVRLHGCIERIFILYGIGFTYEPLEERPGAPYLSSYRIYGNKDDSFDYTSEIENITRSVLERFSQLSKLGEEQALEQMEAEIKPLQSIRNEILKKFTLPSSDLRKYKQLREHSPVPIHKLREFLAGKLAIKIASSIEELNEHGEKTDPKAILGVRLRNYLAKYFKLSASEKSITKLAEQAVSAVDQWLPGNGRNLG